MKSQKTIYTLEEFLEEEGMTEKYEQDTMDRQIKVLNSILHATDDEIKDYNWVYKKVIEYGIFCFQNNWMDMDSDINWSYCGLMQIPEEFAGYCVMLSGLRIKTAIEVGVYRGRSSYFVCAVLMRSNPELQYILVDIEDKLSGYEKYRELLPAMEKSIPATSSDYKGKAFDYVFIDADHSYDGSIEDFNNIGKNANVVTAFHDIYAHEYDSENGGTVRTWKEVVQRTALKEHKEFSKYPDKWMGIGCVLHRKE